MTETNLKIFRQEAQFVAGVAKPNQFPKLWLPQVAFWGKSNVGKSSLINAVCKRKSLARVSHTPGRTQQINFFSIAEKFLIADLPGYGFAKVSKNQRMSWERLIEHYFENSEHLKMVNVLIDARRGIKDNDIEMLDILKNYNRQYQIVLTKADKAKVNEEYLKEMHSCLEAVGHSADVLVTSSNSGAGIKELQGSILCAV